MRRWWRFLTGGERRPRRGASGPARGFAYERDAATLERYSGEGSEAVRTSVNEAIRRLGDPKKRPD